MPTPRPALLACLLFWAGPAAAQQPLTPPTAALTPVMPSIPLPEAAASVLAALLADSLTGGDLPSSPLARARCEDGVAALFPGRVAMVKAGLKDPCAILVREAARRAAGVVSGGVGRPVDPPALASGAPVESGGLKTPPPTPPATARANVTAPPVQASPANATGLIWVRRNETRVGDVVV